MHESNRWKMSAPGIQSVQSLEDKRLLVVFANAARKVDDCNQLLHLEPFKPLWSEAFFKSVKLDAGGYGISWTGNVDLGESELWVNGKEAAFTE
jgi:hypothetical protein